MNQGKSIRDSVIGYGFQGQGQGFRTALRIRLPRPSAWRSPTSQRRRKRVHCEPIPTRVHIGSGNPCRCLRSGSWSRLSTCGVAAITRTRTNRRGHSRITWHQVRRLRSIVMASLGSVVVARTQSRHSLTADHGRRPRGHARRLRIHRRAGRTFIRRGPLSLHPSTTDHPAA